MNINKLIKSHQLMKDFDDIKNQVEEDIGKSPDEEIEDECQRILSEHLYPKATDPSFSEFCKTALQNVNESISKRAEKEKKQPFIMPLTPDFFTKINDWIFDYLYISTPSPVYRNGKYNHPQDDEVSTPLDSSLTAFEGENTLKARLDSKKWTPIPVACSYNKECTVIEFNASEQIDKDELAKIKRIEVINKSDDKTIDTSFEFNSSSQNTYCLTIQKTIKENTVFDFEWDDADYHLTIRF